MIDYQLYQKLVKEATVGNVTMTVAGHLTLFKYTPDCHHSGNWNKWNLEARGIIIDDTGRIICRPMAKFFNLGERPESSLENLPDASYIVYEKLDGSCGNAYVSYDRIQVATPGSMSSDQAIWASNWLNKHLMDLSPGLWAQFKEELKKCTPVFEILWPDNPGSNVVNYGQREELVLLAIRLHNGEEISPHMVDAFAEKYRLSRPKEYNIELANDMDKHIEKNAEGYVIYYPSTGLRVKVKSDLYKMLHKMLDQLSPKGILELIRGREYRTMVKLLEECSPELARQADDISASLRRKFFGLKAEAEYGYRQVLEVSTVRKEQAFWIQRNVISSLRGAVFGLLDDKAIDYYIWDVVKKGLRNDVG